MANNYGEDEDRGTGAGSSRSTSPSTNGTGKYSSSDHNTTSDVTELTKVSGSSISYKIVEPKPKPRRAVRFPKNNPNVQAGKSEISRPEIPTKNLHSDMKASPPDGAALKKLGRLPLDAIEIREPGRRDLPLPSKPLLPKSPDIRKPEIRVPKTRGVSGTNLMMTAIFGGGHALSKAVSPSPGSKTSKTSIATIEPRGKRKELAVVVRRRDRDDSGR